MLVFAEYLRFLKITIMKRIHILFSIAVSALLAFNFAAYAQNQDTEIEQVRTELLKMIPVANDAEISLTEVEGVYQV